MKLRLLRWAARTWPYRTLGYGRRHAIARAIHRARDRELARRIRKLR